MNPLADLTQAPLVYKVADKQYEISPLTHADYGAFCRFVQFADYYALRELPGIPDELIKETLTACLRKTVTLGDEAFNAMTNNPAGMGELAFLALRRRNVITREDVADIPLEHVKHICELAALLSAPVDSISDESKKKAADLIVRLRERHLLQ